MNAILRNEYEATVLTHEAIEVHLSYLRSAVEGLTEKLDRTNQKIEQTNEKIERISKETSEKIERVSKETSEKVERASKETSTALDELRKAILRMDSRVSAIDSRLSAIVWVGGGLLALITVAVTVGQAFKWL